MMFTTQYDRVTEERKPKQGAKYKQNMGKA